MKLLKHIGRIKETDSRVLVIFMSLPDDPNFALVLYTDSLPPMVNDEMRELVESKEAQGENEFSNYLARKTFKHVTGTNETVLQWLHVKGLLKKIPVSSVIMTPHPGVKMGLDEVLKGIESQKQQMPISGSGKKFVPLPVIEDVVPVTSKNEPLTSTHVPRSNSNGPDETRAIANNLKLEAQLLRQDAEREAERKENQAAELLESIGEKTAKSEVKAKATKKKKTA